MAAAYCQHDLVRLSTCRNRANRKRHKLSGRKVAEPALIRNRTMAQQLCEHAQSLVGEILVDQRFLSAEGLSRAEPWRFRMPSVFMPSSSVKTM